MWQRSDSTAIARRSGPHGKHLSSRASAESGPKGLILQRAEQAQVPPFLTGYWQKSSASQNQPLALIIREL